MKNKMLKKGLAIGMSAFLLASSLAPVSVQAASWKQNKTGWWWQEDNGSYPVSQWKVINGKWYAFDERGYMRSGWFLSNGKWYYLGAANDGSMKTGWQLINGSWYYFDNAGWMLSNQWIGNYYVGGSGAMLTDTWIGNYYVDGSGKWVPDAKKDQHTHKWVAETTVITHPAETHQELVKEAWTEEIPHEEEGHYEATVPGHWEYKLMPATGYMEEYETIDGGTATRFVVTEHMHTDSKWVDSVTQECNEYGLEVQTPMYHEVAREVCNGCGKDITDIMSKDGYNTHAEEEALNGNMNCGSWHTIYIMEQYDTRSVIYPATYVIDKEAWTETVQHEAEYKTVVDKEAWTETITKNVCSECGAVQ